MLKNLSSFRSLLLFLLLIVFGFSPANAQQQGKSVLLRSEKFDNQPVLIKSVKLNNTTLSLDKSFSANDYWWKDLEIEVENISNKPVSYLDISLAIRYETKKSVELNMTFGSSDNENLLLQPQSRIVLKPNSEDSLALETFFKTKSHLNADNALLSISTVQFGKESSWKRGALFYPSKTTKGGWIKEGLKEEDFKQFVEEQKESLSLRKTNSVP